MYVYDMMKCPICNKKLIEQVDQTTRQKTSYWFCKEHKILYTLSEIHEKQKYQQRLDNVLKHFEDVIALKKYVINQYLEITYWSNKFHLSNPIENTTISLNTVESILKDLGVMK